MTIRESLDQINTIIELNQTKNIEDGAIKILEYITNKNANYLIDNAEKNLQELEERKLNNVKDRLKNGEPIQYIIGKHKFMDMDFLVNKDVFISSKETEILVNEVISIIKTQDRKFKILDLCTGSGTIAISIAKNVNNVQILATDISSKALKVANCNSSLLLKNKDINQEKNTLDIRFMQSNLFENIQGKFDLIVSNPPYGESQEIRRKDKDIWKQYEPIIARDGGKDGLDFYKRILFEAYKYLNPKGFLCLEIGLKKRDDILQLAKESGKYNKIYFKKDIEGYDRIMICRNA